MTAAVKKVGIVLGLVLLLTLGILTGKGNRGGDYHLKQFASLQTNFNTFNPSLLDRLRGIKDNQGKWNYHLRKLEQAGVAVHTNFVFTGVPYTVESSRRIWTAACSNFPSAIMFTATHYATNDPAYGVRPYAIE